MEHPLRPIVTGWLAKIKLAMDWKRVKFQDDADEAMRFFNGPHDFMYSKKYVASSRGFSMDEEADVPTPTFRMTVNKVAEMVQLFGPVLYHKNPVRQVNPRKAPMIPIEALGDPNNPMIQQMYLFLQQQVGNQRAVDQARAALLDFYLNYTPNELGLKDEARSAIDEAIIKGMGILWTELYKSPGSQIKMIGSFYDTVDNLAIDPDMETIKAAQWIARRCVHPVWQVEQEYGLQSGALTGNLESLRSQGERTGDDTADYNRRRGQSNDLLVYWKVYSKMGMGGRLSGVTSAIREELDRFGDYCFLVVCDQVPYPLNLPPQVIETADDQETFNRVQWPIPFWADDAWPFSEIVFHPVPREVWPMSHLKPGMGELKFLNWAYSFIASKIRITSRDFFAMKKSLGEEIKNAVLHGQDLTLLEIEQAHGTISDVVQFLQHPPFNGDIWRVIEAVTENFEKRIGLNELLYGMSTRQLRSAAEANVKQANMQVRPDDMSNRVEDTMTAVARKEALAARWYIEPQDVLPIMGPVGAQWWGQIIQSSQIGEVVEELEYRIEAGSARKPNKDRDAQNMGQAMQVLLPFLSQYTMATGDVGPVNNLLADWAKAIDLDPKKYLLRPPPPPMPAPPPQQQENQAA